MPESDRVWDALVAVLQAAEGALGAQGLSIPSRVYVSPGPPAADCDQLTAHAVSIMPGLPGQETAPYGLQSTAGPVMRTLTVMVQIRRCVPVPNDQGQPPQASSLEAAAKIIARDGWTLWRGLVLAYMDGTLLGGCDRAAISAAIPSEAEGGLAGWDIEIAVQL